MLSLFIHSFKVFRYCAQDNFLSKIRPNILIVSVNFISRLLIQFRWGIEFGFPSE